MKITLKPVVELGYYNQGNEMPLLSDSSVSFESWVNYRKECLKLAGMPMPIAPTFNNTDFYAIENFSGENLSWLINQHISSYIEKDYEQICAFFGGYVLLEGDNILMYPQCCGDLSDIIWWKHICYSSSDLYCNGHPSPIVEFKNNIIYFNCIDEIEPFDKYTKSEFMVESKYLVEAYESMLPYLINFRDEIAQLMKSHCLPISSLELANILTLNNPEIGENNPYVAN